VTRQELRRRYSQLIRQYKPEHAPEEFRRIRDAFEVLQQHAQWRERFAAWHAQQSPGNEGTSDATGGDVPGDAENNNDAGATSVDSVAEADPGQPRESRTADQQAAEDSSPARRGPASRQALAALIEDAWDVARGGDPPQAYQALVELHQQHPGDEDLCVRLYWLLSLWPAVDPRRAASDWLYAALARQGLSGRMGELLRSHFEDDPQAALDPRCEALLRGEASAWQLVELAAKRWQAAATLGRADVIAADLQALKGRLEGEATRESWARALLAACEALAWMPGGAGGTILSDCRRQLDELGELQLSLSHELDRRDLLQELTAAFASLRPLFGDSADSLGAATREELAALERLLSDWWRLPFHEVRSQAERTLHPWVVSPQRGLAFFDRLRARAPVVLSQLTDLIEAWHAHRVEGPEEPADAIAQGAIARFFNQHVNWSFDQVRGPLLSFCFQEWIWPPQLLKVWAGFPPPADEWSGWLDADVPFRCICRAYEAAWS
jgi:hypothetical protein